MQTIVKLLNWISYEKGGVIFFFFMTFLIGWVSSAFYEDDFINHPQFVKFEHWNSFVEEVSNSYSNNVASVNPIKSENGRKEFWSHKRKLFHIFFLVDVVWAFLLLTLMFTLILRFNKESWDRFSNWKTPLKLIFYLFLTTYLLDFTEGILYNVYFLFPQYDPTVLKIVVYGKMILYGLALITLLEQTYRRYKKYFSKYASVFLRSSWLSTFFLIVIGGLLSLMEQGSSLIIAAFDNPYQLFIIAILLYILSIILSHYPVYLLYHFTKTKGNNWERLRNCCNYGIIKYNGSGDWNYKIYDIAYRQFRYFMGALVYLAFAYAMLFTYGKYVSIGSDLHTSLIPFVILIFIVCFAHYSRSTDKKYYYLAYTIIYGLSWILLFAAVFFSSIYGWSPWSFWTFSGFLILRSYQRLFQTIPGDLPKFKWLSVIRKLHEWEYEITGKYLNKLVFIKWTGFAAALLILFSHVPSWGMQVNPIIIILCIIHNFYGIIIIILKNYFYYKSNQGGSRVFRFVFTNILWILIVIFGVKNFILTDYNKIHYLKPYAFNKDATISVDSFLKIRNSINSDDSTGNIYISSWGGGLRATYYNLLWLKNREENQDENFMKKVVAMSGVSGGSLGIHLYFSNKKENHLNKDKWYQTINSIGRNNYATTDIVYLFGRDRIPFFEKLVRDRSVTGISNYWHTITSFCTPFDTTPYQTYWHDGFNKLGYYPILISNATKTHGRYGVSCSAYMDSNKFNEVFKGATNMVKLQDADKSLSFFEAFSASERFPFFSATASVEGQGHYVDGGYFENSGLLSLMHLREYINSQNNIGDRKKDSLIILGNSKSNYIESLLFDNPALLDNIKIKGETNFKSIFKGVLDTDRLPGLLTAKYFKNEKSLHTEFHTLPYPLRYNELIRALGGELDTKDKINSARYLIKKNNERIDSLLNVHFNGIKIKPKRSIRWHYAYPSLSRYLSQSTVNYYHAVVNN